MFKSLWMMLLGPVFVLTAGCSSVSFIPADEEKEYPPYPSDHPVKTVQTDAGYQVIGVVSCQESASSSIWNCWTDNRALIEGMKQDNLERLKDKVREIGGDVLINLKHDILTGGGGSGGLGLGVGVGSGSVGVGLGTTILGSNPRITVNSYGGVGRAVME